MKTHVGVFAGSKQYLDDLFEAIKNEHTEVTINQRNKVINTPSIIYTFHLVQKEDDYYKFCGMQFANVHLHWSVPSEFLSKILCRLRTT